MIAASALTNARSFFLNASGYHLERLIRREIRLCYAAWLITPKQSSNEPIDQTVRR
jgi:hypothetical protein